MSTTAILVTIIVSLVVLLCVLGYVVWGITRAMEEALRGGWR